MTSANVFKITLVAFIAFEIAQMTFLNLPQPLPFVIGLVVGVLLGLSGMEALSERSDRIEREQWERRWR